MLTCLLVVLGAVPPPVLPLSTVRLYETGMAQFVRSGSAERGASVPMPAAHLDDALKTLQLTTADGKLFPLSFPSRVAPGMARALANLPPDGTAQLDHAALLQSLRGLHVQLRRGKEKVAGRVVELAEETRTRTLTDPLADKPRTVTEQVHVLLLLADSGELRRLAVDEIDGIQAEPGQVARLEDAVDAARTAGRRTALGFPPTTGTVTATYLAETPVWRVTWRLQVGDNGTGRLQGWALIHNDTDEDWRSVRVELWSGKPDSFVYPLAAPRYAERPLVTPDETLATVPQLLSTTPDQVWGDNTQSGFGTGSGGSGSVTLGGHGYGSGGGGLGGASVDGELASDAVDDRESPRFSYVLPAKVDLPAHHSALVPMEPANVEVHTVTVVEHAGQGRTAAWLRNTTPQALPAGPIALDMGGRFAGEAVLSRLAPGGSAWLQHADDLDIEARAHSEDVAGTVTRLRVRDDSLVVTRRVVHRMAWSLRNTHGVERTVHLPLAERGEVSGADAILVDESRHPVAVLRVAPGTSRRSFKRVDNVRESQALSGVDPATLLADASLAPAERAALDETKALALRRKKAAETVAAEQKVLEDDEADVERLQEHLKNAPHDAQLVGRVLKTEDRLMATRARLRAAEKEVAGLQLAMETTLRKLPRADTDPLAVR